MTNYTNPCTPQKSNIDGIVQLVPKCNPINNELIATIIDYIISNKIFIINQTNEYQSPGTYKIQGKGTATTLSTKKLEILDSQDLVIGTFEYGSI